MENIHMVVFDLYLLKANNAASPQLCSPMQEKFVKADIMFFSLFCSVHSDRHMRSWFKIRIT
jgi:hypothetical protein